jgi:hypothetical protein
VERIAAAEHGVLGKPHRACGRSLSCARRAAPRRGNRTASQPVRDLSLACAPTMSPRVTAYQRMTLRYPVVISVPIGRVAHAPVGPRRLPSSARSFTRATGRPRRATDSRAPPWLASARPAPRGSRARPWAGVPRSGLIHRVTSVELPECRKVLLVNGWAIVDHHAHALAWTRSGDHPPRPSLVPSRDRADRHRPHPIPAGAQTDKE